MYVFVGSHANAIADGKAMNKIGPNLVVRPVKAHLERGNIWQRRREDPHRELNQTYGLA